MDAFVISFSSLLIIVLMTFSAVTESLYLEKKNGKIFCSCILTEPVKYLIMFVKKSLQIYYKKKRMHYKVTNLVFFRRRMLYSFSEVWGHFETDVLTRAFQAGLSDIFE